MLTKQKAAILAKCLKAGEAEAQVVYGYLNRNDRISASKVDILNKKVKDIQAVADKSLMILATSFANPKEVKVGSKYPIVENLISQASSLNASAKILAHLVAEGDELSDLPDEPVEGTDDLPDEPVEGGEGCDDGIDSDDDIADGEGLDSDDDITDDGLGDSLDSDDDIADGEGLDSDDDIADDGLGDSLDSDDDIADEPTEPVQSKTAKTKTRFVKASANTIGVKAANKLLAKQIPWNFGKSGK